MGKGSLGNLALPGGRGPSYAILLSESQSKQKKSLMIPPSVISGCTAGEICVNKTCLHRFHIGGINAKLNNANIVLALLLSLACCNVNADGSNCDNKNERLTAHNQASRH